MQNQFQNNSSAIIITCSSDCYNDNIISIHHANRLAYQNCKIKFISVMNKKYHLVMYKMKKKKGHCVNLNKLMCERNCIYQSNIYMYIYVSMYHVCIYIYMYMYESVYCIYLYIYII